MWLANLRNKLHKKLCANADPKLNLLLLIVIILIMFIVYLFSLLRTISTALSTQCHFLEICLRRYKRLRICNLQYVFSKLITVPLHGWLHTRYLLAFPCSHRWPISFFHLVPLQRTLASTEAWINLMPFSYRLTLFPPTGTGLLIKSIARGDRGH